MSISEANFNKGVVSPDCEVQKLKDLVKKLEKQNQHLRNKTGKLSPHSKNDLEVTKHSVHLDNNTRTNDHYYFENDDGVAESELREISNADETNWLYSSPKAKYSEDRRILETWLRDELDHPSTPKLAMARRSIISSLNNSANAFENISDVPDSGTAVNVKAHSLSSSVDEPLERRLFSSNEDVIYNESEATTDHRLHPMKSTAADRDESSKLNSYQVHHMPLPSHTMTSVHGLIPSDGLPKHRQRSPSPSSRSRGFQRNIKSDAGSYNTRKESPVRRSSPARRQSPARRSSPARQSREITNTPERSSLSRRTQSPASERGFRRSINKSAPDLRKGDQPPGFASTYSSPDQLLRKKTNTSKTLTPSGSQSPYGYGRSTNSDVDVKSKSSMSKQIKPPSRVSSRLSNNSDNSSEPASPRSGSSTPRRSLPRPSQASKNRYYNSSSDKPSKLGKTFGFNNSNNNNGQHSDETLSYETKSEGSDVWKDGEFF